MKILIVYGTVEGQTRKIARYLEEVLDEAGHQATSANATDQPPAPEAFDAIILGSSIHLGKYNPALKKYVDTHVEAINQRPSAFFSVCMAIASGLEKEREEAFQIADDFLEKTGWHTDAVWHFAGALKYTQYDYFKRLIMRMIAKKQGGETDTNQDYEYTNWKEVKAKAHNFLEHLKVAT
ncbi:menaquinone-dependent protoporphyrinogen IX dehydrogenase [Croceiramulus getboli]|nr:menaquinone-dependent protoporphyrinogen IX dehydrogenase [Flavobacteriaceae bacterium YJPT1-3]